LYWPCVPGSRPRPDDIDASQSARDEGLRQTEFDSRGLFLGRERSLVLLFEMARCAGRVEFWCRREVTVW
jgi:hypothetical protein